MDKPEFSIHCPVPVRDDSRVQLAHGGGGRLMHDLIERVFLRAFGGRRAEDLHDSAVVSLPHRRIAMTTDSFVVKPLFFPGGDIGTLAVCGTINDLAMSGARPLYLSAGFILEEGFPLASLEKIVASMQATAAACGVEILTGDTKVVDRGKGDGVYINTTGIGVCERELAIGAKAIRPGDQILLSRDIGRHGIAVLSAREGLEFETSIESDVAPLHSAVLSLLENGIEVHCLRDLTRGGLATSLNELAGGSRLSFALVERPIPIDEEVRAAAELLGLDPLYIANEGAFVAFVPESHAERALVLLRQHEGSRRADRIGEVREGPSLVTLKNAFGSERILDMLAGEQLPRIC